MRMIRIILAGYLVALCGCGHADKAAVPVWIENSSDLKKEVRVLTYLDDSLVDSRTILHDSIADLVRAFPVMVSLSGPVKEHRLRFVAADTKEETACFFNTDSLDKTTLVHANYAELVFKKGYRIEGRRLMKDTVYEKRFEGEVLYHFGPPK